MSDSTSNSVSFPTNPDSNDKRPLPEIIADHYGFALAHLDHTDGKRYYAVQDWIIGVAKSDEPRKFWVNIKRRFKKAGIQMSSSWRHLPYRAKDGKTYKMDHADGETLYQITQRMDVNTGLRDKVLQFLAQSGVIVDEMRIDPDKIMDAAIAGYKREGRLDTWIVIRVRGKGQRLLFTAAVVKSMRYHPTQSHFAIITNAMRMGLWKRNTAVLKAQMGLKEKDNLRDHQSEIALTYELLAEQISTRNLEQQHDLDFEEAKQIVYADAEFVGRQAEEAGKRLGIDIATDRPLLSDQVGKPTAK